jgi:hypothetical protein
VVMSTSTLPTDDSPCGAASAATRWLCPRPPSQQMTHLVAQRVRRRGGDVHVRGASDHVAQHLGEHASHLCLHGQLAVVLQRDDHRVLAHLRTHGSETQGLHELYMNVCIALWGFRPHNGFNGLMDTRNRQSFCGESAVTPLPLGDGFQDTSVHSAPI